MIGGPRLAISIVGALEPLATVSSNAGRGPLFNSVLEHQRLSLHVRAGQSLLAKAAVRCPKLGEFIQRSWALDCKPRPVNHNHRCRMAWVLIGSSPARTEYLHSIGITPVDLPAN
jgi:hypothetical protein